MRKQKLQIKSVRIEQKPDESPDLSFLGECSNTAEEFAIDRKARGECGRGEFQYFNPGSVEKFNPLAEWIASEMENYPMPSVPNAKPMIGVIAKAEIYNPATQTVQTIRSAGLWGIESDSGDYLKEVAREQLAELQTELLALNGGIGERAIAYAIKNCEL